MPSVALPSETASVEDGPSTIRKVRPSSFIPSDSPFDFFTTFIPSEQAVTSQAPGRLDVGRVRTEFIVLFKSSIVEDYLLGRQCLTPALAHHSVLALYHRAGRKMNRDVHIFGTFGAVNQSKAGISTVELISAMEITTRLLTQKAAAPPVPAETLHIKPYSFPVALKRPLKIAFPTA
jgi:hypothetical protein